ncbi:hypothetical protein [Pedobacter metabolipauper]|uniref:Late embryogenesis abundant protein n=1 Tax=Pedobacter metabolipauper TaxID=425513 RepID=A0A4R6T0S9_9SPHI|nr:hypothetical protein [Pedobacter metabolipauper]TDQ11985.1 hypothetical protein ATK78_1115 [Pedobacter metabolipauper]
MRQKIFVLLQLTALILLTFSSCNKVEDSLTRDVIVNPQSIEYTIPIISNTNSNAAMGEVNIPIDLDALIKDQAPGFGTNSVTSAKLTGIKIDLVDTLLTANNFANLENISVKIETASQTLNNAATLSNPDVKNGTLRIPVMVTDTDVKNVLKEAPVKFILTGKARRVTTVTLKAKISTTFTVTVER